MSASVSSGSLSGLRLDAASQAAWRAEHGELLAEIERRHQAEKAADATWRAALQRQMRLKEAK